MNPVSYVPGLKALLEEAGRAYRRRDDAAFRAILGDAARQTPYRLDLWFNLANHHIQTGDAVGAIGIFRELECNVPDDPDALFCLAHWLWYAGDDAAADGFAERLRKIRPEKAADLEKLHDIVDAWLRRPLDWRPDFSDPGLSLAVVTLGYRLEPDGTMHSNLVERLEKTLEVVERHPSAVVVVSGGLPKNGRVEAVAMRNWLVERGVDPDRVWEEGYSRDVVENLLYSRQILALAGVDAVLCVTSAVNFRRAGAGLDIVGWTCGRPWLVGTEVATGPAQPEFAEDGRDRLKLFRDALRCYGMPMLRTFPELMEL